eukprot:15453448-Alexandrium_andersonii.AAC.1
MASTDAQADLCVIVGCTEGRAPGANAKFCQLHRRVVDQLRISAKTKEDHKSFAERLKDTPRLSEAVAERSKNNPQLLQKHSRGMP